MENVTVGQLDTNLPRFYAEARNKSGESYSKFSLLGFRHAFERYLNAPPLSRGLKLSLDPRFQRSNEMLKKQPVSKNNRQDSLQIVIKNWNVLLQYANFSHFSLFLNKQFCNFCSFFRFMMVLSHSGNSSFNFNHKPNLTS